jgi:hypothetical protein
MAGGITWNGDLNDLPPLVDKPHMEQSLGVKLYPLLFLAGILSLLLLTGKVSVPWPHRASADPAAKAQDAIALAAVTNSSDSVVASVRIFALLDTAERTGGARGARLIREQLPALAARVEADAPNYRERLAALDLRTSYGRKCRVTFVRLNEGKRWFLYTFANEVARSRSTWPVVRRFRARWHRWIAAQGTMCKTTI